MGGFFNSKSINIQRLNQFYFIFDELKKYLNIKFIVSEKDSLNNNNNNSLYVMSNLENVEIITTNKIYDNYQVIPNTNKKIKQEKDIVLYNNKEYYPFGINGYYNEHSDKNVGLLYQLSKEDEGKKVGFLEVDLDSNEVSFIPNNFSKKYITKTINTIEDIEKLSEEMFNDNIELKINKELYDINHNKMDVYLDKFEYNSIDYFSNDSDENVDIDIDDDIEKNIINEISKLENSEIILDSFNKILKIYHSN
jgi:hypothetical protein